MNLRLTKTLTFILPFLLFLSLNAQKAYDFNQPEFKNTLKTAVTRVLLTGNEEFDSRLKAAFKDYWKVSQFEFLTQQQMEKLPSEDIKIKFFYANAEVKTYDLTFSKFIVMVYTKKNQIYTMIEIPFDDMKNEKKGEMEGADRSKEAILNKIAPYVALLSTQLQKQIDLGNREYSSYRGNTDLIASKTVFIQEEYFKNNIDPTLLAKLNFKVVPMNNQQISSILKDKNEREKHAWFCIVTSPTEIMGFIIDLRTGDLLNYAKIDKAETPKKTLSDKSLSKIIKEFND